MNCDPKALLAAAKCYQCVPKAVWGPTVISLLCEWANNMAKCTFQSGAGSPVGVAVPKFIGQLYHDTTNHTYWRSTGLTNADWIFVGGEAFVEWLPHSEIATWNDSGGVGQVGDYATFLASVDLGTLTLLNLDSTAITSLVATYCTSLITVTCTNCTGPLTLLNLTGCGSLSNLSCQYNSLTSASLIISGCNSLSAINCGYNPLGTLSLDNLHVLTSIHCEYASLTAFSFSGCELLDFINCSNNTIANLDDVSGCPVLTALLFNFNSVVTLDLTPCTILIIANGVFNSLSAINVTGLIHLDNVDLSYNSLTTIDLSTCLGISVATLSNNLMNAVEVDNVLCDLDALGTLSHSINLLNNTAPTAAGLVCAGNLLGKGWVVNHD